MSLSKFLGALWTPSIPLAGPSKLPSSGLHDSCSKGFHFLIRLAWESRYLLPIMYAVVSFLFDIQMRLEIIIHRERRVIAAEEEVVEEEVRDDGSESEEGESESDSQLEYDEEYASDEDMGFED
ncbi:hypothetical protein ONE63_008595 [Megalurothrips usitatus]|uniref:Uncharacterized protein n=1 Tax=Megalurothrips usitatus TaxID=439358 RepID=A0AAV7XLN7_9NEOP|nr:hypothetical protein ONE63_008595 [Megalurothrips usitatus]